MAILRVEKRERQSLTMRHEHSAREGHIGRAHLTHCAPIPTVAPADARDIGVRATLRANRVSQAPTIRRTSRTARGPDRGIVTPHSG